jgi:hypothetical protein
MCVPISAVSHPTPQDGVQQSGLVLKRSQLGPFSRLLQPVDLGAALVHQARTLARQLASRAVGDEAGAHQAGDRG